MRERGAQLHPIEGLWKRRAIFQHIAVVRDASFDGFDYVAFGAPTSPCGRNRRDLRCGQMVMALGGSGTDTEYEVRFVRSPQHGTATLAGNMLILNLPGGRFQQWIRTVP